MIGGQSMTQGPPEYPPQPPLPYAIPANPSNDIEQLRLLSIFHYVVGGLALLFGSFPLIHVAMGLMIVSGRMGGASDGAWFGWIIVFMAGLFVLLGWGLGIATILSGVAMRKFQKRTFSVIVAGILCAFFPFGTVLGVFTLVVLMRPSVQTLYATA